AERILARRLSRGELWVLDLRGSELTSIEVSRRIARLRDSALDLSLCIGGDEGLAPAVVQAAAFSWSLSRLTLPHRLARVVSLEQLYRAFEILRGGPYHKSGLRGPPSWRTAGRNRPQSAGASGTAWTERCRARTFRGRLTDSVGRPD